ncbi:unnamed protein product [Thelazia callipaeda]|uniref:SWIB domain-containing protein n=1 Tax=Thelazia callipaeda TaxID=103827 RepID=A0A0N5CQY4_THECL|nr:unnamed protein product [Thelazia callipaeda]
MGNRNGKTRTTKGQKGCLLKRSINEHNIPVHSVEVFRIIAQHLGFKRKNTQILDDYDAKRNKMTSPSGSSFDLSPPNPATFSVTFNANPPEAELNDFSSCKDSKYKADKRVYSRCPYISISCGMSYCA